MRLTGQAVAAILVPMALIGIGLPAIMEQAGRDRERRRRPVPRRSIVRPQRHWIHHRLAVSGFVLPQWLGLWNSLIWMGVLLIGRERVRLEHFRFSTPRLDTFWPACLGCQRVSIAQLHLPRVGLDLDHHERLVAISEGAHGITAVVERPHSRRLKRLCRMTSLRSRRNGFHGRRTHASAFTLLLHPAPQKGGFSRLGHWHHGRRRPLFHPVEHITVMELVRRSGASVARFFHRGESRCARRTAGSELSPMTPAILCAERGEHYDVIVGDLVVPWRQGRRDRSLRWSSSSPRAHARPERTVLPVAAHVSTHGNRSKYSDADFSESFPAHPSLEGRLFSPTEPAIALIGRADDQPLNAALLRGRLTAMQNDPMNPQLQSAGRFFG